MRQLVTALLLLFTVSGFPVAAMSAEVLMVMWQGRTTAEDGFEAHLKKLRPDVKFHYIDANRKKADLAQALRSYDMSKVDLVYSFGTTATKIVKDFLNGKKPLVFNMVSTPVMSQLVESNDKPGNNTTGAQLLVDLDVQIDVLQKIKNVKNLGVWFDPREKQNQAIMNEFAELGKKKGINVVPLRLIPDADQVDKLLKEASDAANRMDALYVVATSSFSSIYDRMFKQLDPQLVVMGGVHRHVGFGATIALAPSYTERGEAVAEQANMILSGKNAGEIPVNVVTSKTAYLYVDPNKAKSAGLGDLKSLGINIVERDKPVEFKK